MSPSFVHMIRRGYLRFLLVPLIVFTAVGAAVAQGGVGSTRGLPDSAAGIHSIQGRVYLPTGRRAGEGISEGWRETSWVHAGRPLTQTGPLCLMAWQRRNT